MAAAIPAGIGLGSSIIGGIKGKGARKKQEKLAEEQRKQLLPLIQAQIAGAKAGVEQGLPLIQEGAGTLRGAGEAFKDLQGFWKPLLSGNRNAIDMFLSPERRAINQGYQSADATLAAYAPRGGNLTSQRYRANIQRQGQLSDLMFGARREGANQLGGLAQNLAGVGSQQGGLGTSLFGAGLGGGQQALSQYMGQATRAYGGQPAQSSGKGIGGYLVDLFSDKGVQKGVGGFLGGLFGRGK